MQLIGGVVDCDLNRVSVPALPLFGSPSAENCHCVATFGKRSDPIAKRCPSHKRKGDILKLRMNTKEKRGDWEELVNNENGRTYYYNARLDDVRFEKPPRWVKMLAEQIETR